MKDLLYGIGDYIIYLVIIMGKNLKKYTCMYVYTYTYVYVCI